MASQSGLVHSFWEWVRRSERKLRRARGTAARERLKAFPTTYPTSIVACAEIAQALALVLTGTEFHARASHWSTLLARIVNEGWREVA